MALIAITEHDGQEEELAVARYITNVDQRSCEFALVVSDRWQRKGIGHRLMHMLMEIARNRGLEEIRGEVLSNNHKMLELMKSLGFRISTDPLDSGIKQVVHTL
jgi:acetyltransferase